MRTSLIAVALLVLAGCRAQPAPSVTPSVAPSTFQGLPNPISVSACEPAFRLWVDGTHASNEPNVDIVGLMVGLEGIQRRVFELCSLAEAEQLNQDVLLEIVPGVFRPLIEPDFRTFAEVECVDESPLLDDTALCAEVLP